MKAKTLLIAAAALAAGVLTTQAQVYSQNIVGYVNFTNAPGQLTLVANPFDNGTNTLTSIFPSVPVGTTVQVWNGTGFASSTKIPTGWSPNLTVLPGQGFFIKLSAASTNTFAGSVNCVTGGSVTNALPANSLVLVGSLIPYAGQLTDTNLNLKVPVGSTVQVWNGSGYASATKIPTGWSPNLTIGVGQGFFLKSASATNWVQTLNQ